jgi:hypothetical protein
MNGFSLSFPLAELDGYDHLRELWMMGEGRSPFFKFKVREEKSGGGHGDAPPKSN